MGALENKLKLKDGIKKGLLINSNTEYKTLMKYPIFIIEEVEQYTRIDDEW